MITARFFKRDGLYCGFIVSGHAGTDVYGKDIVCAGVSSAVMLAINTITDFFCADAVVKDKGNKIGLKLICPENDTPSRGMIYSLKKHRELLAEENGSITVLVTDC